MIDELHLDTAVIFQDRIILPLPWNLNFLVEPRLGNPQWWGAYCYPQRGLSEQTKIDTTKLAFGLWWLETFFLLNPNGFLCNIRPLVLGSSPSGGLLSISLPHGSPTNILVVFRGPWMFSSRNQRPTEGCSWDSLSYRRCCPRLRPGTPFLPGGRVRPCPLGGCSRSLSPLACWHKQGKVMCI